MARTEQGVVDCDSLPSGPFVAVDFKGGVSETAENDGRLKGGVQFGVGGMFVVEK